MSETFEQYVDRWDALKGRIAKLKAELAPLNAEEMTMRRAIAASVEQAMGDGWKEGTNTFPLADGRKLKINNKIDRKIEMGEVEATRELYRQLNSTTVNFADLLRTKYELEIKPFRQLDDAAAKVVSRMVVSKAAAPEVSLA